MNTGPHKNPESGRKHADSGAAPDDNRVNRPDVRGLRPIVLRYTTSVPRHFVGL